MRRVISLLSAGALTGAGLLAPAAAQAAPVDLFPDEGFRACVQKALKDTPITEESVAGIEELSCVAGGGVPELRSLVGIKHLTGLVAMVVRGHPLAGLAPVPGAPKLEEFQIINTKVTTLSQLSGMKQLRRLGVKGSSVSDLSPVSGLPLDTLYLQDVPVADLAPVASATLRASLRDLQISSTRVNDVTPLFTHTYPVLETLLLEGHPITEMPTPEADAFPVLKSLYIRDADLDEAYQLGFAFDRFGSLELLDLSMNRLSEVPSLILLGKLKKLYLNDNRIMYFRTPPIPSSVTHVDISGNEIADAGGLKDLGIPMKNIDMTRQRLTIYSNQLRREMPTIWGPTGKKLKPKGCLAPVDERCQFYYDEYDNWELETLRDGTYQVHYQEAPVYGIVVSVHADLGRKFVDVPTSHTFFEPIEWLADSKITGGYGDRTFRPKASVTRGQMAAFLRRRAGSPSFTPPSRSPFSDVSTKHPFYRDIMWLRQSGITGGFSDGTFKPGGKVTRGQMAMFLYRAEGKPAFTVPAKSSFKDVGRSGGFFRPVMWLVANKVTGGYANGTFGVSDPITRGQFAAFLYRLREK